MMNYFRKFVLFTAIAVPLGLPFFHDGFRELGEYGWIILVCIMLIRPLADVFPDLKILRRLVPLRKEFGILSAVLILSHSYGYFLEYKLSFLNEISNPTFWDYSSHLFWGMLGSIVAFLLLITSNMIAIRILKKWWKPLQTTAYLFFLFGGIHIIFVDNSNFLLIGSEITAVIVLWLLSYMNVKVRWKKPDTLNL